jgi:hypothetical protein
MEPQAAADGGTIAMDGRQPMCVRQRAADVASMQQRAAERRVCNSVHSSKRMGAASSTIAMEDSDGSRRRWWRKEQRLTATAC